MTEHSKAAKERVYPLRGRCAYCGKQSRTLFWHEQDGVKYCADVWACEARVYDAATEPHRVGQQRRREGRSMPDHSKAALRRVKGFKKGPWWMDEVPMPAVRGGCMVCKVTPEDVADGRVVVSPTGLAHHGDSGDTSCGKDATGPDWWWPL